MMKRPIRKAAVTEEKEGVVIDPERDCNRKGQGVLSVMGLTITNVRLGALAVFTGSGAMAQDTAATAPTAIADAIAPVLKADTRDPRMGPHLQRAAPGYDEVGVRSFTADWSGATISRAWSFTASSCFAWSADLDSCRV